MKKTLTFLISWLAFAFTVQAQKNFEDAYIVFNNGDTIHGFIDNKDWEQSPKTVTFKKTPTAPEEILGADAVELFFLKESLALYMGFVTSCRLESDESSCASPGKRKRLNI
jgi:hypothetical protein